MFPRLRIVLPPGEIASVEDRVSRPLRKLVIWGLVTVAVVVGAYAIQNNRPLIFIVDTVAIYAIIAMSMNIQSGYAGLFNLAIGGIVGVGAYIDAWATLSLGYPVWIVLPLSGAMAAGVGFGLSLPSLRLKGLYFGLMSIMIQLLIGQIFNDWISFTGGGLGQFDIPALYTGFHNHGFKFIGVSFFYLCLAVLVVWGLLIRRLTRGHQGLALSAVRFDDELAGFLGVDVTRQKMLVFIVGSFFAGVAGALLAAIDGFISPDTVDIFLSAQILIIMFVGGFATFWGPIVGSIVMTSLPNFLEFLSVYQEFIYGAFLIFVIIFVRGGIVGVLNRYLRRRARAQLNKLKGVTR